MKGQESHTESIGDVNVTRVVVTRLDRKIVYALGTCFLSCLLMCALTLIFAAHIAGTGKHNAQNFCSLVQTLDGSYESQPPQTATGKLVAGEIHTLIIRLGCQPGDQ